MIVVPYTHMYVHNWISNDNVGNVLRLLEWHPSLHASFSKKRKHIRGQKRKHIKWELTVNLIHYTYTYIHVLHMYDIQCILHLYFNCKYPSEELIMT